MRKLLYFTVVLLALASCSKPTQANSEADIVSCELPQSKLKGEPMISNNEVMLMVVKNSVDKTQLAPAFTLSKGATISPESGTVRDFTEPQVYVVTSESGEWKKPYVVRVVESEVQTKYNFENWEMINGKFRLPYEPIYENEESDRVVERQKIWSSGNSGYAMSGMASTPEGYPTCMYEGGYGGSAYAAKLETRATGSFGEKAGMPLAAGNLFIGSFNSAIATQKPLEATKFGVPFGKKPIRFRGYYKYKAGEVFKDKEGNVINGVKDSCQMYAILYEPDELGTQLNGSNALTSDRLIATAVVKERDETSEFRAFEIEFVYTKEIDPKKLADYKYNLGVVMSSSHKGGEFAGAIGSVLIVDDVEVVCEEPR